MLHESLVDPYTEPFFIKDPVHTQGMCSAGILGEQGSRAHSCCSSLRGLNRHSLKTTVFISRTSASSHTELCVMLNFKGPPSTLKSPSLAFITLTFCGEIQKGRKLKGGASRNRKTKSYMPLSVCVIRYIHHSDSKQEISDFSMPYMRTEMIRSLFLQFTENKQY